MSVREEDSPKTSSSGSGLGFAVAAIGVGVSVGAALYYFFGQKEPEAGSSSQWEGQQFTMEYTDNYNTSNDYITTTDTSIYETDPDESLILSESEDSVEYENIEHYSERSIDELETSDDESVSIENESIDEESDNAVMSVNSSDLEYDDQEERWSNQNTDSDVHNSSDSESVYEGSENDSEFEHIQQDDFVDVSSEDSFRHYRPFPQMLAIMGWQYSSVNSRSVGPLSSLTSAKKREAFRERSWTLEQCSICFDVILKGQEVMSLACTHRFHTTCILPWLEKQQTCPNCRKSI
ncbi:E3 ubiquitin-protein ligase CIP8-like isoform X2 [Pieris brassicae]|uniref:E3 ubiquitin-protein ligase CIP8-like isoform X2 n=1 Tax=Pieris brassicae TaxID=7116 RepID=UPI001E660C5B|nr:E3 ubiquitin-protein ligase CIP8-like isoform X2 [Pieris brassicae]